MKISALALRPRREMKTGEAQFAGFRKHGIQTYVSENGVHGSSMLVESRVKGDVEPHRKVVIEFIKSDLKLSYKLPLASASGLDFTSFLALAEHCVWAKASRQTLIRYLAKAIQSSQLTH